MPKAAGHALICIVPSRGSAPYRTCTARVSPACPVLPQVQYTYFTSTANRLNGPNLFGEGLQGRVMRQCFILARGLYTWMM